MVNEQTRIFGVGLSRTGTVSLGRALRQLGIEAVHYPDDAVTPEELVHGRYALSILSEVQAILDIPVRRAETRRLRRLHACVYGALHFSPERFRYVKRLHEKSYFADRPDKLLVLDVFRGDGWPELCSSFPDEPYPHQNAALTAPAKPQRSPLLRLLGRSMR
jgi:hypothetical protein